MNQPTNKFDMVNFANALLRGPVAVAPPIVTSQNFRDQTGYRVWVGGKSRWFRSLAPAEASYQRCRAQHGDALVQLQDVRTGATLKGGRS